MLGVHRCLFRKKLYRVLAMCVIWYGHPSFSSHHINIQIKTITIQNILISTFKNLSFMAVL
jgi:hypothetical protein